MFKKILVPVDGSSLAEHALDFAEKGDADLVALTTHGASKGLRWLFGSVSEKVLRNTKSPLLVQRVGGIPDETVDIEE